MSRVIGSGLELDRIARASESDRMKGSGGEQSPEVRGTTFRAKVLAGVQDRRPDGRRRPGGRTRPDEGLDEAAGQCDGPEPDGRMDGRTDGRVVPLTESMIRACS